jgi:hypothetical protein
MLPAVLVPLVGLAIDASMLYIVQAKLSGAVDGAALGAGRLLGTPANTAEIAGEFLNANFPTGFWGSRNLTPNITYTKTFIAHTISVSATVDVPLLFMRILGYDHTTVAASAVATRKETRVEVVLDRSGSMSSEITSLKNKAAEFVGKFISGYDEMGLVVFGGSAVVGYPTTRPYNSSPTSAGGPDSNFEIAQTNGDMLDMIGDISSGGDTNTAEALWLAYLELQKANNRDNDPTRLNAIVLFTDGIPTSMTVNLNDPSNLPSSNSLKTCTPTAPCAQCQCTNNPGTAGDPTTQMIGAIWGLNLGVAGTRLNDTSAQGLYRLASASNDSNSTAYWMAHATSDQNGINPSTPVAGCHSLKSSYSYDWNNELRQIPPNDYWNNSTSDGTAYQASVLYNMYKLTYDPTDLSNGYHFGIACWNAVDSAAKRILADTNLNVIIYVIGYTANDGVDTALLKRVANTKDSTNHNSAWQTGLYVAAGDDAALEVAFQTVASAILRLAH